MKGVDWGTLYNQFKDEEFDTDKLEKQVAMLMMDDDVTRKPGVYPYVLDGDEKHLNIRAFTPNMKREAYERQKGVCVKCKKKFAFEEMEGDHIKPWHEGGKTEAKNCQMLCKEDNRRKSGK
jgi:5-methylcytosine-specific restriction endonuclease McrA